MACGMPDIIFTHNMMHGLPACNMALAYGHVYYCLMQS